MAGSAGSCFERDGIPGQGETQDGSRSEAAASGTQEEEDVPPPYSEVVGTGTGAALNLGEETFV